MRYQKLNVIFGWLAFAISAFVYISTIEPTASFWDCGEFIATGFKLEVGHPPGAPVFMLLTRFFTLFAGNNLEMVPVMANIMSALASAFTILFLFWSITHLARKIINKNELSLGQTIAIIGSGMIGALAYTFSDTFWFSAVEGEVYATSSLITAFVFWAILKWENIADEPHSNRWIILIAFIVGLSIGVHLLNLLAIPAMVLVYYFRKYQVTVKGVIWSLVLSGIILGTIMWIIVPGVVKVAFVFDLLFVNSFGLPFNSGVIFFVLLMAAVLALGIYYTRKKHQVILNTIILAFTVMMIGYSSYGVIIIRSNATPPIDQNDPEDAYSLLGYLNREQYGERPLMFGQYYDTPLNLKDPYKEGGKTWMKGEERYEEGKPKISYNYNPKLTMFFPRMYSSKPEHIQDYKSWAKVKGYKIKAENNRGELETFNKPTFVENMRFFIRYQIGHMYWRYFMWNYAGRQNDIQGHGGVLQGNWISGIKFLDEARLGPQDNLPTTYANNRANNKYYLLPFILGIIGLVYQLGKDKKNFWIVMSLFILTGLAIVVYLNQSPQQPRERDYAYAGSFYAFAIWIGLGVLGIYESLKKYLSETPSAVMATVVTLFIPALMAAENWDDHDRSDRYIARDFAYNYLNSVEKDGVIFTNGDNDTFPLWYIQEVEEVRTDVRVICLPYLITDWYIDQMKSKYYESEPVPFSLNKNQYVLGKRDQVPVFERVNDAVELKQVIDFVASDDARTQVQTTMGEKTDYFPTKKFKITVDKEKVLAEKVVKEENAGEIVDEIRWNIGSNYILKNDLMILDLLASANWERPIYFVTVGTGNETNMRDYFQLEGFAYRFVPIKTPFDYQSIGRIDTDILYDNLMNKFRWGNMADPHVYLDENIRRTIRIVKIRNNFGRLAKALVAENKKDSAKQVMLRGLEVLPIEKMSLEFWDSHFVEALFEAGLQEQGRELVEKMAADALNDLRYYTKLDRRFPNQAEQDKQICFATVQWLNEMAQRYGEKDLSQKLNQTFEEMYGLFMQGNMQ
ncbi:MAG: hypothetical protein CVU09_02975 [Bacteroidetes bacterium HGW-Bacteroidetes-4]|jgi:hypothetical protein|nr:MAG: hypothetical protein CVU09_02975 [Bacteroidetes bacterium HGW-Bacteroidetes-4]